MGLRVLCLATDGFGGHGGIALHCRLLLEGLSRSSHIDAIYCIPRVKPADPIETNVLPAKVHYHHHALNRIAGYARLVLRVGIVARKWDVIITEHIHLLPIAALLAKVHGAKLALITHGFEAWQRPRRFYWWAMNRCDHVVSVSSVTRSRFLKMVRV